MAQGENPISIGETIFVLMLVAPVDILEMVFGGPFFFLGPLFIFVDMAVWFCVALWLTLKGVNAPKSLGRWGMAGLVELIPFVEILPIRTFALMRLIYKINSSRSDDAADTEDGASEDAIEEQSMDTEAKDFAQWEDELEDELASSDQDKEDELINN